MSAVALFDEIVPGMAFAPRASGLEKAIYMFPPAFPEPARDLALAVIAASQTPLLLLDGDLKLIAASTSFCHAFQIDPASVPDCRLLDLGAGEWGMPQLGSLLGATVSGFADVEAYEMDLVRQGQETHRLVLNAHRLDYADDGNVRLLMAVTDITAAISGDKLKDELIKEKAVLLQELQHRVANSLQVLASVILQSALRMNADDTRDHLYATHERILSVATLQRQLAVSTRGNVALRPYFTTLCDSLRTSMIRDQDKLQLELSVDDSVVNADVSVSLGLIVTELVINALKHAFPGNRAGRVVVDYFSYGPNWRLSVRDNGVGMPANPERAKPGLGTSIVEALTRQLNSRIKVAAAHPGTDVSIIHAQLGTVDDAARVQTNHAV